MEEDMSKAPAFQMYAADALSDCLEMTNEEMGVYMRLLLSSWVNKSIPSDTSRIARIVAMTESEFLNVWPAIEGKFQSDGEGRLVNPRLEKTRQEQEEFKAGKSKGGKASAEARKKKAEEEAAKKQAKSNSSSTGAQQNGNKDSTGAQQNGNKQPNESSTKSNSSSSPSSSNSSLKHSAPVDDAISAFDQFWSCYPVKKNKAASVKAWKSKKLDSKVEDLIADVVNRISKDKDWIRGAVPYPSTYINGERWNDEVSIGLKQRGQQGAAGATSAAGKIEESIRARRMADAGGDGQPVADHGEDFRPQVDQQLWSGSGPRERMGNLFEGSCTSND